jgi:hypothetical protein
MALSTSGDVAEQVSMVAMREYVVIAVLQSGSTAERFRATMPDNGDSRDFKDQDRRQTPETRRPLPPGSAVMTMMCL